MAKRNRRGQSWLRRCLSGPNPPPYATALAGFLPGGDLGIA